MKKACSCLTKIFMTFLIIIGLVIGGGIFAYNEFAKPITGLGVDEVINVVHSLYGANRKEIVTNSYGEEDLESFYSSFKKALFLTDDSVIDIADILNGTLKKPENTASIVNETNFDNPLFDLLKSVNFDFSTLKNYDGEKQILHITDKEISAVINEVYVSLAEGQFSSLSDSLGIDITEVMHLEQTIVKRDVENLGNSKLTITFSVNIKKIYGAFLSQGGLDALASATKWMLPETIYLSVSIFPETGGNVPKIIINNNNDEIMKLTLKLINNVAKNILGSEKDNFLEDYFSTFDKAVKEAFAKIDDYVSMEFVESGFGLSPIYAVLKALKVEAFVSEQDFLYMIKFLNYLDLSTFIENVWKEEEVTKFLNDFKIKLAIPESEELTAENFIDFLGNIDKKVDFGSFDMSKSNEESRLIMNYDALAGIFASEMNKKQDVLNLENDTLPFSITNIVMLDETKGLLSFTAKIELRDMILEQVSTQPEFVQKLVKAVIPEVLYITIIKNMKDINESLLLTINGSEEIDTNNIILTICELLKAVGGEDIAQKFEMEVLKANLNAEINKFIEMMNSSAFKINFTANGLELPTIYEVLHSTFELGENISGEDVHQIILGINNKEVRNGELVENPLQIINSPSEDYVNQANIKVSGNNMDNIKADLYIRDKDITQIVKDKDLGNVLTPISVEQIIFINHPNELLSLPYSNWIAQCNFKPGENIAILTVKIDLRNIIEVSDDMIPKTIYITIIQNLISPDSQEEPNINYFVNNMGLELSDKTLSLIEALAKKSNQFINIKITISNANKKLLGTEVSIAIPPTGNSMLDALLPDSYNVKISTLFSFNIKNHDNVSEFFGYYNEDIVDKLLGNIN